MGEPKHKVELIVWLDHCSIEGSGWHPISDALAMEPEPIYTVGWVIKETDVFLVVVNQAGENTDHISGDVLILKSCITLRKTILNDE